MLQVSAPLNSNVVVFHCDVTEIMSRCWGIRGSIDGSAYPWISIIETRSSDARFQRFWIMLAIFMLELTTNSATFTVQSGCWDSETPCCNVVIAFNAISVSNVKQKLWRPLWIREVLGANLGHIQGDTAGFQALVEVQLRSPFFGGGRRLRCVSAWLVPGVSREHCDIIFKGLSSDASWMMEWMKEWMRSRHATLEDEPSHCLQNWGVIHPVTRRHSPEIRDLRAETVLFAEPTVHGKILTCIPFVVAFPFYPTPL